MAQWFVIAGGWIVMLVVTVHMPVIAVALWHYWTMLADMAGL